MAKVTIKGIPNVEKNIKTLFDEVKSDPALLLEVGEKAVELTVFYARTGKNTSTKSSFPGNSTAWDLRKIALTKTNKPDEFYQPFFSNVTFTGQLLRSIGIVSIDKGSGSVTIDAKGNRTPYKNLKGEPMSPDKTPTNSELIDYLKKLGRNIFGINKNMENVINKIVRKHLNARIRKTFK